MLKKFGVLALTLSAWLTPSMVLAQDGYRNDHGYYRDNDRRWDRRDGREWRNEWEERRREEWRERRWREHEWREHEWRERARSEGRWNREYYPDNFFYFGYRR